METTVTQLELFISIAVTLIGGFLVNWLFWHNRRNREKRINGKINEIKYQEKLLESLDYGYKNLLQYAFKNLFISLAFAFSAITSILFVSVFPLPFLLPVLVVNMVLTISVGFVGLAAAICYKTFNDIVSLKNLDDTKSNLEAKKEKLKNKI
ncbi:hypothetical protein C9J01_03740 [Photobacterium rosenbergii]|uniref:DUF2721 domain-containing protein n=1 Tax=Photobacterium rosenbergii TaxID=294936 RepID=A0A2T3NKT8_9GAMM|nr:hypothetical protein [Photobacterium rosenbergii]PSW16128.1 hypothetical protein C9J01_03740 [Photobacterium rosenbergii]